jgi:hypothetical protein
MLIGPLPVTPRDRIPPEEAPETIGEALTRFRRNRRGTDLATAVHLAWRQGRLVEAGYGAWCFVAHQPCRVRNDPDFDVERARRCAESDLADLEEERTRALTQIGRHLGSVGVPVDCTLHGFARANGNLVVGEYADRSARLFIDDGTSVRILRPYEEDPTVRHIHSILSHEDALLVATGDGGKYLDRFRIRGNDLSFERRVIRRFGGFTTCAVVGGRCWFGSDFSERPNYLFSLETGEKHFFPGPAYTKWSVVMLPLEHRYLYCINTDLSPVSRRAAVSIFDTRTRAFVHCSEDSTASPAPDRSSPGRP